MRAAGSPGTAGKGFRAENHHPYWNPVLEAAYCHQDGEPWPCLHHRQTAPPCRCDGRLTDHGRDRSGRPICWHSPVCGCTEYRKKDDQ